MRGRFAPSPTGAMHLGNARTALLAWLAVRRAGGQMILRLEDLDRARVPRGAADRVLGTNPEQDSVPKSETVKTLGVGG